MTSDRRIKGIHFAVLLSVWMVLLHTAAFAGHGVEDSIEHHRRPGETSSGFSKQSSFSSISGR